MIGLVEETDIEVEDKENDPDLAQKYIEDVLAGRIVVCKWVRLAIERHVRDLKRSEEDKNYPFYFDPQAAALAIKWFDFIPHTKGKWAGKRFVLTPFQCFIQHCVDGWKKKATRKRRFKYAFIFLARKNGKTQFAAGNLLRLTIADNENAAECYAAATKRKQARYLFEMARDMRKLSPAIRQMTNIFRDNINVPATGSKFEPLGQDSDTEDGLSVSGAAVDEYHAHKDSGMFDVLDSATGARDQPLIYIITTAGEEGETPCRNLYDHACRVLEGKESYEDDSLFAYVATLDEGDDPFDESVWVKASPNLYEIDTLLPDMRDMAQKAAKLPSARNEFLQKKCNLFVQTDKAWLDVNRWDDLAKEFDPEEWAGADVYAGWDLANRIDVCAFAIIWKKGNRYYVKTYFWIPEDTAAKRARLDRVPYLQWRDERLITLTPGNVTDYDIVEQKIAELSSQYQVKEIGYDPKDATQPAQHLQDNYGIGMFRFNQGYNDYNEPCRELERLMAAGLINHDGNKVMRWMVGNVSIKTNQISNQLMPKKPNDKSTKRIDGVSAMLMALGRAIVTPDETIDIVII